MTASTPEHAAAPPPDAPADALADALAAGPAFARAGAELRFLVVLAVVLGGAAAALFSALLPRNPAPLAHLTIGILAGALLSGAGAIAGAAVLVERRRLRLSPRPAAPEPTSAGRWSRPRDWVARRAAEPIPGWVQPILIAALAALALGAVARAWPRPLPEGASLVPPYQAGLLLGGFALLAGFLLLVLERSFAVANARELPEAPSLARTLRLPVTGVLAAAGILLAAMAGLGLPWSLPALKGVALLLALVPAELILRAAVALALPAPREGERRFLGDSAASGLLTLSLRPRSALRGALKDRLGIDLQRSWALGFVGRALLPVALGVALLGWLTTGITTLALTERGVYERFGAPVAVLGPGLHGHLPWPLGIVRPVENGALHEIAGAGEDEAPVAALAPAQSATIGAEAATPPSLDRLWDVTHNSEVSYVIAGVSGGAQSFQIVDIDVRFVFRAALDDQGALAVAYRTQDPAALIRAVGGRLLARYFASRTLDQVLGERRDSLSRELTAGLQADLDGLRSGLQVVAVAIEAIHPPAGAADAYHQVQAAGINALTQIDQERGYAAETIAQAKLEATDTVDVAQATGAELKAEAGASQLGFAADGLAAQVGGKAFLIERYFERLAAGLSQAPLTILDHRIAPAQLPTLDLRGLGPADAAAETTEAPAAGPPVTGSAIGPPIRSSTPYGLLQPLGAGQAREP